MSLYDDKTPSQKSFKLLQESLRLRQTRNVVQDKKSSPSVGPIKPRNVTSQSSGGRTTVVPSFSLSSIESVPNNGSGSLLGGDWDPSLEYDPFRPNDYEKLLREKKEKAKELKVVATKRLVGDYSDDEESGSSDSDDNYPLVMRKAAIPPPKELTKSDVPSPSPLSLISSLYGGNKTPSTMTGPMPPTPKGMSTTAVKIMAKMGYRDGSGLGKDEQGIARPLEVIKVGTREGKIIGGDDPMPPPPAPITFAVPFTPSSIKSEPSQPQPEATAQDIKDLMRNPTKVVLLTNMVGPGEVDDDLEPEIKEECGKYGDVVRCVIFELPGSNVTPELAVRIFVEFVRIESAIKAVIDLNGRFFGGRTVKASFYDVDKFKRYDLLDSTGC